MSGVVLAGLVQPLLTSDATKETEGAPPLAIANPPAAATPIWPVFPRPDLADADAPVASEKLRLHLIGSMQAWQLSGESALPRNRKTRALLALIALHPRPIPRTRLVELLWPGRGEDQARNSLRQALHELGAAIGPDAAMVLAATRDAVGLVARAAWTDVLELRRATPERPQALALLQGVLLEDFAPVAPGFDAWLAGERRTIAQHTRGLAEAVLERHAEPEIMLQAARALLGLDRTHEAAWRALMRAHAAAGRRDQVLAALEDCRAALQEARHAAPSAETLALADALRKAAGVTANVTTRPGGDAVLPVPARAARPARLGVAPLRALGDGAEDAHLPLGLAEEIATALARFRWIPLVSCSSLARYAAAGHDDQAIGARFELDFLLGGTVQRAQGRVRVMLRLSDLRAGGEVVWAQRFDRDSSDILAMQDEIAAEVVARIDPELLLMEARRAQARPVRDAAAYELLLRAIPAIYRLDRAAFMEAAGLLEAAIAREPDYAAAHAWYALWHVFLLGQGWAADPPSALARAGELAERAVLLDPADARGLTIAGHVRAFLHHRLDAAIAAHDRALALNPNLPMAWVFSAVAHAYRGEPEEALRRIDRYKRLSPMDPHAFFLDGAAMLPHLLMGDDAKVQELGRHVVELHPGISAHYKPYLSALGHLGRHEEAARVRARLLALEPNFTVRAFLAASPFAREVDRERFAAGLRLAGLPESAAPSQ